MRVTLDNAGRISIPKLVRNRLQLKAGDKLELKHSDGNILLQPVRRQAKMRRKHGIWVVCRSGEPLSAIAAYKAIQQIRRERDAQKLGEDL